MSPSKSQAIKDFDAIQKLLSDLGLPQAPDKNQPPSLQVTWLGIRINSRKMTLSVPAEKLREVIQAAQETAVKKRVTRKQMDSVIGKLLHISKCIRHARIFVARLLEATRGERKAHIPVSEDIISDLEWFASFAKQWNGIALMDRGRSTRDISVSVTPTGIAGTDGTVAYEGQVAPVGDGAKKQYELEAINVLVAIKTLTSRRDAGGKVTVHCQDESVVEALRTGRGRNSLMQECARRLWLHQSLHQFDISYVTENELWEELSYHLCRAHISTKHNIIALKLLIKHDIPVVNPSMSLLYELPVRLLSRSGHDLLDPEGSSEAESSQSGGD